MKIMLLLQKGTKRLVRKGRASMGKMKFLSVCSRFNFEDAFFKILYHSGRKRCRSESDVGKFYFILTEI